MGIRTIAAVLAAGAAAADAGAAPLFELVPVPAEYAPTPTPTPAPRKGARPRAQQQKLPAFPVHPPAPPAVPVYLAAPMPPVPPMPAPPREPHSRLQPRTPPVSWVSNDDFPAVAMRENMQGTVGFVLDVDVSGRASACRVYRSSGWPVLDSTTCALMRRRARFLPATDGTGAPIPATYTNRFRWELPFEAVSPMASWARVTRFAVNGQGEVMGCFTHEYGAVPPSEKQPCDVGGAPDPEVLAILQGTPAAPMALDLVELHRADGAPLPAGFTMPAGTPVEQREVRLTIGDDGYVRGCEQAAGEEAGYVRRFMEICAPQWTYPAALGSDDRFATWRVSLVRH